MQVESADLSGHIVERLDKHFDVIFAKVAGVERSLYGSQRSRVAPTTSAERSVTERLADIEANVRSLDVTTLHSAAGRTSDAAGVTAAAAASAGATAGTGSSSGDVQSILVSTSEKMIIYEGVITVLNREVEKLSTQVCPLHLL